MLADAVRRVIRRPRWWVWLTIMAAIGVGLGQLPLVGVLGYELAVAVAIPAAIAGLDLGAALARELARGRGWQPPGTPPVRLVPATLASSGLALVATLIPAVIAAIRGLWTTTCDTTFGLLCYAAMPATTAVLAGALGHAIGVVVGPRRWLCAAVAQLPVLLLIALGLYRFYAAPPVFSYSPLVGYFPGNMYDENVKLELPLLWARLEQLGWVVFVVALIAARSWRHVAAIAIAIVAGATAGALHLDAGQLGYAIDASDVADELDGTIETEHFVIHYAHTDDIDRDIALIARDHELRYAEVVAEIGVAPAGKLTSFYFASGDQKARWMGARDVEMAKPWRHEIYLDHRAWPHPSLRHEIAHAIASAFGDPLFGVAAKPIAGLPVLVNPGLVEGLAVALDWPGTDGRLTPHEAVRAMQTLGLEPSLDDVLSLQFFSVSSARGYTTAGSFLRFLFDGYGADKLRAVYRSGGDFEAAYGKSLDALADEWRAMLAQITLPPDVIEAQRERYRATSVFARPCPHAIAAARERAGIALGDGDRTGAIAILRDVCSRAPEEPRYRFELGELLERDGDDAQRGEAEALWHGLAGDREAVTTELRAEALDRLAHAAGARGDLAAAKALVAEAHALPLDGGTRRQLDAEMFAFDPTSASPGGDAARPGEAGAFDHADPLLLGYFFSPVFQPIDWAVMAEAVHPDVGFVHYLVGLQRSVAGDQPGASVELQRALALGLPGRAFVDNAARKLAVAAYRAGDVAGVRVAIAAFEAADATTVDRLLGEDWQTRLDFDKRLSKRAENRE